MDKLKDWDAILFGKVVPWDVVVGYLSTIFWITKEEDFINSIKKDEDKKDNDWG